MIIINSPKLCIFDCLFLVYLLSCCGSLLNIPLGKRTIVRLHLLMFVVVGGMYM